MPFRSCRAPCRSHFALVVLHGPWQRNIWRAGYLAPAHTRVKRKLVNRKQITLLVLAAVQCCSRVDVGCVWPTIAITSLFDKFEINFVMNEIYYGVKYNRYPVYLSDNLKFSCAKIFFICAKAYRSFHPLWDLRSNEYKNINTLCYQKIV